MDSATSPPSPPETVRTPSVTKPCAYCGGRAVYVVRGLKGAGFCCGEPTHWSWLYESVRNHDLEYLP